MMKTSKANSSGVNQGEAQAFRRVYVVCFCVFLFVVMVSRVLPQKWRPWHQQAGVKASIISEAKSATETFVPFAFIA